MPHAPVKKKTHKRTLRAWICGWAYALLTAVPTGAAYSQNDASPYPSRPVTLVVPYGPGGSADPIARKVAQQAQGALGQQIVIVNKPGASGTLGMMNVLRAKPDGYTLGLSTNAIAEFQPLVAEVPFSSAADYQPLVKLANQPAVLSVHVDSPLKTFGAFVDEAKSRPGRLTVSTAGKLGVADMAMIILARRIGISITTVPYSQGGGAAITALLGKHVDANVDFPGTVKAQVNGRRFRALAVFQTGRNPLFPDVPSTAELGYGEPPPATYFVIAPKGLDDGVREKLVSILRTAAASDEFKRFADSNGYIVDIKEPAELAAELLRFHKEYSALLKDLGIERKR